MTNQYVWIGIAVGVFVAGIGVGYVIFQSNASANFMAMSPLQMRQMINDPKLMTQWHQQMLQNPQAMNQWMSTVLQNPQAGQWMMGPMMNSPQAMSNVIGPIMNDPKLQQQMYEMMFQNQQFMQQMMNDPQFQNQWMSPMMGQGMMGNGMMGSGRIQGSSISQPLPTGEKTQTRVFEITLDEVKLFAETENENGEEQTVQVEVHQWNPSTIVVNKGDTVVLKISNPRSSVHSFAIPQYGVSTGNLEPRGGTETVEFVADKAGVFTFICNTPYIPEQNWCAPDHSTMTGTLIVLE